ncbi:MAG: hypothetical protein JWO91_92 [Acidobacteriaceae bacterium]|nr:hypothetical protein [Acidobacteriaceae bacterium]
MKKRLWLLLLLVVEVLAVSSVFAQSRQIQIQRRPPASPDATQKPQTKNSADGSYFVLDGMPMLLELHHDTEAGTNKPIDVYMFVIEMQIMNSDGNLEPVGLQIHNYYTAWPLDRNNDVYPHAAHDCKLWNRIVTKALAAHDPKSKTWPYLEFLVANGARMIQTNEDGQVWWSDDVQCWGSSDRFPPF